MNETDANIDGLRTGLIAGIRAARAAERDVFAALEPDVRDAPAPDGGWSPKDVQAHLSAWKGRTVDRLRALRDRRKRADRGRDRRGERQVPRRAGRMVVAGGRRRRGRIDRRAHHRDRGRPRRDARASPDQRHDHGQRLRAHPHPPDTDRGRGRPRLADPRARRRHHGDHRPRRLAGPGRRLRPLQPCLLPRAQRQPRRRTVAPPPGTPRRRRSSASTRPRTTT